jgi:Domain of unknown function (DUF5049)
MSMYEEVLAQEVLRMTQKREIKAPQKVISQIEMIRKSGKTNMFDATYVQRIAHDLGYHALVVWIQDHRREYLAGIILGFEKE